MAVFQGQTTVALGNGVNTISKLQGQTTVALGNGVNTISKLQGEAIASLGYTTHTNFLITGGVNNSLSLSTDALSFIKAVNALPFSNYQPYESRFARFFGLGARQDASKLYLQKADLGLASVTNNTAESILVALLLQVLKYESNNLISRVTVEVFDVEFLTSNNLAITRTILVVNLYSFVQTFEQFEILITSVTPNNFN